VNDITAELVPPVPPVPELAPDAAAPEAAEPVVAAEKVDPAAGPLRRAIIDHLVDTAEAGPQSVAMILAAMPPGTSRNTLESALRRSLQAGEIERTGPGLYVIGKPKPPGPAKPAPSPEPAPVRAVAEMTDQDWLDALEAWLVDSSSWDVALLGPPPTELTNRIPPAVKLKFGDRLRKRAERKADREQALARQAEADAKLRDQLLAACNGNCGPGLAEDDLAPVKKALELVPLDQVLFTIRSKVDKRTFPGNPALTSWSDPAFLKVVAERFCKALVVPGMVKEWSAAGTAQGKAVDASNASPPTPTAPEPQNAPAPSSANGSAPPSGDAAELGPTAASLMRKFGKDAPEGEPTRESIIAALRRGRTAPQPATPQPGPAQRQVEPEITETAFDEYVAGWVAGNLEWPRQMFGPAPGENGCRVPVAVLKRNRLT
jgi:hypothetical protein